MTRVDIFKEAFRLENENRLLRTRIKELESQLCRAREALEVAMESWSPAKQAYDTEKILNLHYSLSSPSPCRHEEELKRIKRTLEIQIEYHAKLDGQRIGEIEKLEQDNSRLREAVEEVLQTPDHGYEKGLWIERSRFNKLRRKAGMEGK